MFPALRVGSAVRVARLLIASIVLAGGLFVVPAANPAGVAAVGPLPECRLANVQTIPHDYDDWRTTLVDWILTVGKDYVPPDLVNLSAAGVTGGGLIRKVAMADLSAMASAAKANGTPLGNVSSYRSYDTQVRLFNSYAKSYGYAAAVRFSARPGHSEHQLGLAIDFGAAGSSTFVSETTPPGRWLARHAWEYGWVLSYPKGKTKLTCYNYEPWHYRYLGRELAAQVHASGLTIREYLWAHDTAVDPTTGKPVPTATPVPTAPPSAVASPPATESPAPTGQSPSGPAAIPSGPIPSDSPAPAAASWFGLDPPLVVALLALVLTSVGLIASLGLARRSKRS